MKIPAKIWRMLAAALMVLFAAEAGARAAATTQTGTALRWHDYATSFKAEQLHDLAQSGGTDVVIFGTSMAQQDLVPSVLADALGQSVYNAGLNGGVPVVMERWSTEEVIPRLRPKTVLWGLSALDLSAAYGDATKDAYDSALETKQGWLASSERQVAELSAIVRNRTVLRSPRQLGGDLRQQRIRDHAAAESQLGQDGERINFTNAVSPARAAEIRGRITPFALDREDIAAVVRTVRSLEASGIQVVLVELPVPARFLDLYPSGPDRHQIVESAIVELGNELDVPVVQLDEEFQDADFVDYTHLDAAPAERFSAMVGSAVNTLVG